MTLDEQIFNPACLKIAMGRRRISVYAMATQLGHDRTGYVIQFLKGKRKPTKLEVGAMAKILEWPEGFFYKQHIEWPEEQWISGYIVKTPIY